MKAKIFVPILSVILVVSLLVSGYSIFGGFGGEVSIDPNNVEIVTNNDNMVAKEHPDFTVEEVEIIPPEGTNIALGKAVSDNGFQDVYVAKNAVEMVAKELYISAGYLMHLFKDELGKTFNECLTEHRINVAKELLTTTKSKVYEVSCQVGYKDVKYFSQIFKKITGRTPSEYAKTAGS